MSLLIQVWFCLAIASSHYYQLCTSEKTGLFNQEKSVIKEICTTTTKSTSDLYVYPNGLQKKKELCYGDPLGFEAISMLHSQIDDDQNGNLDQAESHDFLKEDLKRDNFVSGSHYHENDDLVSVEELWDFWIHSEVHNWTVNDVVSWLEVHVGLGQYANNFRVREVDGRHLPRLAFSVHSPLYGEIGIKNNVHKQKISLKATDIVLFGVPKVQHTIFPDTLFVFSILLALVGSALGYRQHKRAKLQLQNLANDLRTLQTAEDTLKKFQTRLEESQRRQREEEDKRDELRRRLMEKEFQISSSSSSSSPCSVNEEQRSDKKIKAIQEELVQMRLKLMEAERMLEERRRSSIPNLQQWLQLTYEIESRYFEERKSEVVRRLQEAKQMCERMKRQKLKIFGSLRSSEKPADINPTDVKHSLEEIKTDMEERMVRWKEIERVTSLNVAINPGIPYLNNLLRGSTNNLLSSASSLLPTSSSMLCKVSTVPGHLNNYPTMTNLFEASIQLSAVGLNNPMMRRPNNEFEMLPNRDSFSSLPETMSNSSLNTLDGNSRQSSATPPPLLENISKSLSGPINTVLPFDAASSRNLDSQLNTNNNDNEGVLTPTASTAVSHSISSRDFKNFHQRKPCNGHHKQQKKNNNKDEESRSNSLQKDDK